MFLISGITKKQQVLEQQKCTKNDRKKPKPLGKKFSVSKKQVDKNSIGGKRYSSSSRIGWSH